MMTRPGTSAPAASRLTRSARSAARSWTNTSAAVSASGAARLVATDSNATHRPSAESDALRLSASAAAVPPAMWLTRRGPAACAWAAGAKPGPPGVHGPAVKPAAAAATTTAIAVIFAAPAGTATAVPPPVRPARPRRRRWVRRASIASRPTWSRISTTTSRRNRRPFSVAVGGARAPAPGRWHRGRRGSHRGMRVACRGAWDRRHAGGLPWGAGSAPALTRPCRRLRSGLPRGSPRTDRRHASR